MCSEVSIIGRSGAGDALWAGPGDGEDGEDGEEGVFSDPVEHCAKFCHRCCSGLGFLIYGRQQVLGLDFERYFEDDWKMSVCV